MNSPTCDANLAWPQYRITFGRVEPMQCRQHIGLRTIFDENGQPRYACAALGHVADVVRRFGVTPYGDAMDALDARREAVAR